MHRRVYVDIGGTKVPALLMRKGQNNSRICFEGNDDGLLVPTGCTEDIPPIDIPRTALHELYYKVKNTRGMNSFEAVKQSCEGESHEYLLKKFKESVEQCKDYCTLEPFYPEGSRSGRHSSRKNYAHLLVTMLEYSKYNVKGLDCSYVDREISCLRTTDVGNLADFPDDPRLCSMDILLRRNDTDLPVITEVKAVTDKGPSYALVQLLKYASEMASEHQAQRLKRHYPEFKNLDADCPCVEIQAVFEGDMPGEKEELSWTKDVASRMMEDKLFGKMIRRVVFRRAEIVTDDNTVTFSDLFDVQAP